MKVKRNVQLEQWMIKNIDPEEETSNKELLAFRVLLYAVFLGVFLYHFFSK